MGEVDLDQVCCLICYASVQILKPLKLHRGLVFILLPGSRL